MVGGKVIGGIYGVVVGGKVVGGIYGVVGGAVVDGKSPGPHCCTTVVLPLIPPAALTLASQTIIVFEVGHGSNFSILLKKSLGVVILVDNLLKKESLSNFTTSPFKSLQSFE